MQHTQLVINIAQSSNLVTFVSQSSLLGPLILDFDASYHMSGKKSLFSHLSYLDSLPSIIVA